MCLNCYSEVTVKFAPPILNETTAKIFQTIGTTKTSQTTKYCQMLDQFFHCLFGSLEKHQKKTKPLVKPYVNKNHERFSRMTNQFLPQTNTWEENTQDRPGDSLKMLNLNCLSVCKHIMAYKSL